MDVNALISAGSGLLGVIVGAIATGIYQWRGRVIDRYRDQLQNLYSPMLGLRQKIKAVSEMRLKVNSIASSEYIQNSSGMSEAEKESIQQIHLHNNKQLKEEIIPAYNEMVKIFTERMYLAEVSTRKFYGELVEFVEILNRQLAESLPIEVNIKLDHDEKKLFGFYDDIELNFSRLQNNLSSFLLKK